MRPFHLLLITLLISTASQAQTFKVVKIQGKKAIVEFNDPSAFSVNQSYSVGGSSALTGSPGAHGFNTGRRAYGVAANLGFSSLKSDAAGAETANSLYLQGEFLWNMKQYEVGPVVGITSIKQGSFDSSSNTFGAKGYYNFQENKPGVDQILSVVAKLALGTASANGSSSSVTDIEVGGNYRWFLLSQDHCLTVSGIYSMTKQQISNKDVTTSGFEIIGGIGTYF